VDLFRNFDDLDLSTKWDWTIYGFIFQRLMCAIDAVSTWVLTA
jgi:hypothetical protein